MVFFKVIVIILDPILVQELLLFILEALISLIIKAVIIVRADRRMLL